MNNTWIGVDLDGTLAHYDEWRGVDHIGAPIPVMMERVRIFTARVQFDGSRQPILDWLHVHGLPSLEITNIKDSWMLELWDDRVIQVERNTGKILTCPSQL